MTCKPMERRWDRKASGLLVSTLFLALLGLTPVLAQTAPHTPAVGTPERQAIFDAMRKLGDDHTRIFVVKYLKVQDKWAWMSGEPQSPDGKDHFEPESALLHNEGTGWKVVDQPCGEDGCDGAKELARIRAAYPTAPAGIFPQ